MAVITYLEAIRQALFDEMARDERVFVHRRGRRRVRRRVQGHRRLLRIASARTRVIDTPISEQAIVGAAIGASYMGMRPVCEIQFIDFIACCFDMLTNFAATSRYRNGAGVPIVVRGPCGGGVGGGPFHSLNPESFFLNTPGLKMVEPSTAYDAKGLLKAAIRDDDPVLYFEHKFLYRRIKDEVPDDDYIVPLGKAAIRREGARPLDHHVRRDGAHRARGGQHAGGGGRRGGGARPAQPGAARPGRHPDDVAKTSRALLLHEATLTGGIGGELAAIIAEHAFEYLDAPVVRVASADAPVPVLAAARSGVSAERGDRSWRRRRSWWNTRDGDAGREPEGRASHEELTWLQTS